MNKVSKLPIVLALIAIVLAIGGYFFPQIQSTLGSTFGTRFPDGLSIGVGAPLPTTRGGLVIGTTGTAINNMTAGTCYIRPYATTIVASSTALVDCQLNALVGQLGGAPLPGVRPGDAVQSTLATSTVSAVYQGVHLLGATASNTPGYIQLELLNLTGNTFTWPLTGTASGTAYYTAIR